MHDYQTKGALSQMNWPVYLPLWTVHCCTYISLDINKASCCLKWPKYWSLHRLMLLKSVVCHLQWSMTDYSRAATMHCVDCQSDYNFNTSIYTLCMVFSVTCLPFDDLPVTCQLTHKWVGYLIPTWAWKITCQRFDWMLQSSSVKCKRVEGGPHILSFAVLSCTETHCCLCTGNTQQLSLHQDDLSI